LTVPVSGTRPTSDRVREALFASIDSRLLASGRSWVDVSVCDAWAGSGAIALEAWSRGSTRVLALERSRSAVETIQRNIKELAAQGVGVQRSDVSTAFRSRLPGRGSGFDVLIGDPSYKVNDARVRADLAAAIANDWLVPGALVVIERGAHDSHSHDRTTTGPFPDGIDIDDERSYGDTMLWYGRVIDGRKGQPQ
jgi:16S rRNA (guanine966-N2)-methyltransferase